MEEILKSVRESLGSFKAFYAYVEAFFREDEELNRSPSVVHSTKGRIKDIDHLRMKIERKNEKYIALGELDKVITKDNVFSVITDICGIRILHVYQAQAAVIHRRICEQIDSGEWYLVEPPKAYTWDPESIDFFRSLGLDVHLKESFYTSVHYVIRPRPDSKVACEIQVRTLFEEIWGEIDHSLNYPVPASDLPTRELLKVLARLVGSGSRLADSMYRICEESRACKEGDGKEGGGN